MREFLSNSREPRIPQTVQIARCMICSISHKGGATRRELTRAADLVIPPPKLHMNHEKRVYMIRRAINSAIGFRGQRRRALTKAAILASPSHTLEAANETYFCTSTLDIAITITASTASRDAPPLGFVIRRRLGRCCHAEHLLPLRQRPSGSFARSISTRLHHQRRARERPLNSQHPERSSSETRAARRYLRRENALPCRTPARVRTSARLQGCARWRCFLKFMG